MKVRLPKDRRKLGVLEILDTLTGLAVFGPIQCYGKADQKTASLHGNSGLDPRKPYGSTPLGGYGITDTLGPDNAKYGQYARLVLVGNSGDALIRQAATNDLRIHGGPISLGAALLRPTNGCLRVLDKDMKRLLEFISNNALGYPLPLNIEEGEDFPLVDGGPDEGYEDPEGG
jgi:hypothetical protein